MGFRKRLPTLIPPVLGGVLVLAPGAAAHIEIKQERVPADKETAVTFDAENEQSDARTVKLDIQTPEGVVSVAPRKVGGWRMRVRESGGEVKRVTVTAPSGDGFGPGEVTRAFRFSLRFAPGPARTVAFKTVQTYDNGVIARWIGPPGSEEPAPRLRVSAARATPADSAPTPSATDAREVDPDDDDDSDSGTVIAVVAAAVVMAGVIAAALWRRRRRPGAG